MAQLVPTSKEVLTAAKWIPEEDIYTAMKRENDFMAELARRRNTGSVINAVIHFPFADGHARYLVVKDHPLRLMHLPFEDAWEASPATIRGLRLADVQNMVASDDALRALINRTAKGSSVVDRQPATT